MTSADCLSPTLSCSAPVTHRRTALLMALFAALTVTDLVLTWYLRHVNGEGFYEANPVAETVLERFGWLGLGCYKLGCAGTVLAVTAALGRRRPRLARRVLAVGCPILAAVVGYSLFLLASNWQSHRDLVEASARQRTLEAVFHDQGEFYRQSRRLAYG